MLDYVDQERLPVRITGPTTTFRETLAEELQVLFVDEFQDTSPIQLAAVHETCTALAEHVVWVGDIKQAIYGFRGSDPELMIAVLDGVESSGGTTDVLENSWRSRPALVNYANAVFVPTFAESLSEEQVMLEPQREGSHRCTCRCKLETRRKQTRNSYRQYRVRYPATDRR